MRVIVEWALIAPNAEKSQKPKGFNATDPNSYPSRAWAGLDNLVRYAAADGVKVDFTVSGGAPLWAEGKGVPAQGKNPQFAWKPNAAAYGQFVQAVGTRYDGAFTPKGQQSPLPAVTFWSIYNEPNFGEDLGSAGHRRLAYLLRPADVPRPAHRWLERPPAASPSPDDHLGRVRCPGQQLPSAVARRPPGSARQLRSDQAAELSADAVLRGR